MNKNVPLFLGTLTVGLIAGGVFGYHYAKNALQEQYDILLEDEIEELRRSYKRRYKKDEFETPEKAAETLLPKSTFKGRRSGADIPDGPEFPEAKISSEELGRVVEKLRYDTIDPEESWVSEAAAQEKNPDASGPEIIPIEAFENSDLDHYQLTWRYYEADDILVDEQGDVVVDRDEIIGKGTLKCFGQGSNDIDRVYVRNTDLERDYEVIREAGKFGDAETVEPPKKRHPNRTRG